MIIKDNSLVLFQGDSITDCGRNRNDIANLGMGYPYMISAWFSAMYPEKGVKFINKGISGDRVKDLQSRWKADCLDLKPDYVSILIGINDCWRKYDSSDETPVSAYESGYRKILTEIRENLDAKIIICEPFVLPVPEDRKKWREDLDPKIAAARNLSREFNALYLPLDGLFAQASTLRAPDFWAPDGVHPSPAGHALIAQSWLDMIKR